MERIWHLAPMTWNFILVRQKMEEEGRTPKWLAKQIGMDVKSLRYVLRGRKPSLPVIKLIALNLGIQEEDLLIRSDSTA